MDNDVKREEMNRFAIKYILVLVVATALPVTLMAQKEVRKNVRKGNKEYQQQKYSEAADRFNEALEENPASKEATFNLGNATYRQKDWPASVELYQHFVSLEQENPLAASEGWHNIGNAMLQQKELQASMDAYKMALRLNPEDEEARYNLAVVQKMIQDEEQEQDPDDGDDQEDQQQDQEQQEQETPQTPPDQEKRPEQPEGPEQMSRDNARQLLQAIEQDERETQEKVQEMKAREREERAEDIRRRNKNW